MTCVHTVSFVRFYHGHTLQLSFPLQIFGNFDHPHTTLIYSPTFFGNVDIHITLILPHIHVFNLHTTLNYPLYTFSELFTPIKLLFYALAQILDFLAILCRFDIFCVFDAFLPFCWLFDRHFTPSHFFQNFDHHTTLILPIYTFLQILNPHMTLILTPTIFQKCWPP